MRDPVIMGDGAVTILHGDCRETLATLPDASVHCCVTSPPYFGLRDYGHDGQIGLEQTPEAYVAEMVAVFREVKRVLRDDATVWLNLGDSYAANRGYQVPDGKVGDVGNSKGMKADAIGLKPKDLVGIPWRVAFALQADGWYLRQDIIWHKPNPMPESVTDRCTKAHEYIFLLTKSARYWYDAEAVKEDAKNDSGFAKQRAKGQSTKKYGDEKYEHCPITGGNVWKDKNTDTRNKRSVWTVTTKPYSGAHFATFPPKLIQPCILAGCPEKCCPECGTGWERVVEKRLVNTEGWGKATKDHHAEIQGSDAVVRNGQGRAGDSITRTLGFRAACSCNYAYPGCAVPSDDPAYVPYPPVPGVTLDPFGGSGTTALVALQQGRNAILCELNAEYIELARARIARELQQRRLEL